MHQDLQQLLEAQRQHASEMISAPNNYFDRNTKWLMPLAAILFVLVLCPLISMFAEQGGKSPLAISPAFYGAVLLIGAFSTGFGAKMTDTVSARIVEFLGFSAAAGFVVYALFR